METPEQITCSLGVMMMRCLLQELSNRLSHALKTPEVVAALTKQEMLTDKQDWMYMLWDKDNGKLMPDPTRNPLSTKDLQQTIQDAANMLQHHPEVITRFCSTQRLDASTQHAQVPFLIDVSLRDGRMFQILQHGGQTASPLQALIRRLVQTRRAQLITLGGWGGWGGGEITQFLSFCTKLTRLLPMSLPMLLPCCSRVAPVLLPRCSRVAPVPPGSYFVCCNGVLLQFVMFSMFLSVS